MENIDYAHIFAEIADLLEIQGANPFRVRAYRNAARTLETLPQSVNSLLGEGEKHLEDLPSIGKDLARKIVEIERTGELEFLSNLRQEVPPSLLEILRIPGLGAKRINQMWKSLGIISIDQLEAAAQSGKLDELRGFGETIKASVLKGIKEIRARSGRFRISEADAYVKTLLQYLKQSKGVVNLEPAGSYRRRCETVGDLDILATTSAGSEIVGRFIRYPKVRDVLAQGPTKSSIRLDSNLQVDLRLVDQKSYGAALHYF